MEKLVRFRNRQEMQAADFRNIGLFARASLDHIVRDAFADDNGWADFEVEAVSASEVQVSAGRVYLGGRVYIIEVDTVLDLSADLPAVNKRWVAIVSGGRDRDTTEGARDFLIDVTTGTTEPAAVPLVNVREATIDFLVGVEATQPVKPSAGTDYVVLAWVYCGVGGIETVETASDRMVPQVSRTAQALTAINDWKTRIEPRLAALASDIAAINAALDKLSPPSAMFSIAADVARLKEQALIPDDHSDYGADHFLTLDETDATQSGYDARVFEGARFPYAASDLDPLDVFNPLNPLIKITDGFLLPAYTNALRFSVGPFYEALSISQYQYQDIEMQQKTRAMERILYGQYLSVCTNYAWWQAGWYDRTNQIFHDSGGGTWEVLSYADFHGLGVRLRYFWKESYTETYWDRVVIDHTIAGQQIGQTFLCPQDGWLTQIGLFFTSKGGNGNVDVALTEVKYGRPDNAAIIGRATLNVADMKVGADGTVETQIAFPPTYVEAGKRYALVLTTGGNHYVGMAQGTQYAQGSFFYSVDGAYFQGTNNRDLMFNLYFANFKQARTIVEMDALSLSGGIALIDITAPVTVPKSCDLVYEVQVAGAWHPLQEVRTGATPLLGLPPLVPLRAVFNGTTDVQPGIDIAQSRVEISRPKTAFTHFSDLFTLNTGTQDFKVIVDLENYYEANHDLVVTIQKNGSGSYIAAGTVVDEELDPPVDPHDANHKRIRRTFTWSATQITSSMTSVRIKMVGATTSALDCFHVGERIWIAF